jgi:hypothetical protein
LNGGKILKEQEFEKAILLAKEMNILQESDGEISFTTDFKATIDLCLKDKGIRDTIKSRTQDLDGLDLFLVLAIINHCREVNIQELSPVWSLIRSICDIMLSENLGRGSGQGF